MSHYIQCPKCGGPCSDPTLDVDTHTCDECGYSAHSSVFACKECGEDVEVESVTCGKCVEKRRAPSPEAEALFYLVKNRMCGVIEEPDDCEGCTYQDQNRP